eukprot:146697_1
MTQELEPDIAKLLAQANAALNSDQGEQDFELNEEDMNDPDLLAQLAEFGDAGMDDFGGADQGGDDDDGGDEKMFEEMKAKGQQSIQKRIAMVTNKANQYRNANHTANYKICTQTLKELKVLLSQVNEMDAIEYATDKDEIMVQMAQIEDNLSKLSAHADASNDTKDEEATENVLLQRYKMYKYGAKKAKDAGDNTTAIHYLRQSKLIAKYVEQIREGLVIWLSDVPPALEDELWQIKVIKNTKNETNNTNDHALVTVPLIESRIHQYKTMALKAKAEGNIELAKQYYTQMKEMKNMVPYIKSNQIKVKVSDLPNAIQTETPQRQRKLSKIQLNGYQQMIKQLKLQIEECKSDASFLMLKDESQKRQLLQYAKQSQMMLQKVIECQKLRLEPPQHERLTINIETLNVNNDIEENECRIIIGKLSNLATKDSTHIYLTFEVLDTNFQSATKKVKFSSDFKMTKRCKIENNKKLKNKIKYGKLNIGLFQDKLFGDVQLGAAVLKLKPLLETSSISQVVTLKPDNGRKKIADLMVQVKLRKPVLTDGYTVVTKQLIKITKFPEAMTRPQPKPKPVTKQEPAPVHKAKQQTKQEPTPVPKARQQTKPNLPKGLTVDMVENPLGIAYIESFECISKEIELMQQEILKKGGKNCEDLSERLQGLKTNKTILEVQVNNGILSLEQYTAKIKKAMITDLTLAKYLKSQKRTIEAAKVFQRYKTMKKEIEGA